MLVSTDWVAQHGSDPKVRVYGDNNDWFAAWALWQMKIYGHTDVRIMNGGRKKWISAPAPASGYKAGQPDLSLRAFLPQVQAAAKEGKTVMIDVRSPQEFSGEILAPPGLPETCHAAAIFRERVTCPGERRAMRTARSRASTT